MTTHGKRYKEIFMWWVVGVCLCEFIAWKLPANKGPDDLGIGIGLMLILPLWLYNISQWSDPFCWRLMMRNYGALYQPLDSHKFEESYFTLCLCAYTVPVPDWDIYFV